MFLLRAFIFFHLYWSLFAIAKDRRVVEIYPQGLLTGALVHVNENEQVVKFMGIPFAQPPVGHLRFKPPSTEILPAWRHIMDASVIKPSCMQNVTQLKEHHRVFHELPGDEMIDKLEFDENCLYLNVFMPLGQPPQEKWPVIVWFHSGDFKVGSPTLWDGSALAVKQKVIVVVPAYRLNILGFFALDDEPNSGNVGMLDQVAALDWVKKKISSFGGSENDICIMGHGAGGTSVALHMLSPLSAGKFNRAIAMSGSAFSKDIKPFPSREMYKDIIDGLCGDFKTGKEVINCYRNIEVRALVDKASAFEWGPVVDNSTGSFLPRDPEDLLEMGQFNKVDFMTGYTNKEDILDITKVNNIENGVTAMEFEELIASQLTDEYSNDDNNNTCPSDMQHIVETALFYYKPHPETSDTTILRERYSDYVTERRYGSGIYKQAIYNSVYMNTYVYRFDYKPKKPLLTSIPDWAYVPHGFELPFVWGMPYWPNLQNVVWNGADRRVVDTVMSLWGNFAKFGNPIQNGLSYKWEVFKKVTPGVMIIDRNFNMSDPSVFDHRAFDFWNEYFPNVIEATRCCNTTQTGFQIQSNSYLIGLSAAVIAGLQLLCP